MKIKNNLFVIASVFALSSALAGCTKPTYPEIDTPDPNRSEMNAITGFDFKFTADKYPDYKPGDVADVKFFPEKDSIAIQVPWYAGIIMAPEIVVSENATVAPISGSVRDFSQGTLDYTVRAHNGTKRVWKVFVKWKEEPEPARNDNPRHILENDNPKYRLIKFGLWGNTYSSGSTVSRSGNYSNGYISNTGNPTSDMSVQTIYFIARHAGELQMALRGTTASSASVNGNTFNVRAFVNGIQAKADNGIDPYDYDYSDKKTAQTDTITLHRIILPEIPEGHVGHQIKLEIRGKGARAGNYYYRFYEFWTSGWATRDEKGAIYDGKSSGVNFSYSTPRDGLAAPSIHMNMSAPAGNMEYFYTEVTIPEGGDPLYCYYMTSGNSLGYAGIQTNSPTERRFLFSIWAAIEESDPAALKEKYNPKIVRVCDQPEYRPGIYYKVFGGEGTGGQSYLNVNWETGKTYKVLLRIRPHPDQVRFPNSTLAKAWFHNGKEWMFMCEWRRQELQPGDKDTVTPKGPYWYTGASHFVEDFNGQQGHLPHTAYYSNHWFITDKGQYVEPTGYIFTGDQAEGRADVAGGVFTDGPYTNSTFLKSGGYFTDAKLLPSPFTKPAPAVKPDLDLNALNAMGTDDPTKDNAITPGEQYTE